MKKTLFLTGLLLFVFSLLSQAQSRRERIMGKKNHIMIDPLTLIAAPAINMSYERVITEEFGLGVHGLFGVGDTDDYGDWIDHVVQVSPFAKVFLAGSHGAGFFMEAFVPITSEKGYFGTYDTESGNYVETARRNTSVGLGVGLGGKWLLKRSLMLEVGGGLGRKLINKDQGQESLTGKWMIGLGYAF